jgi:cysteine desulfurase
MFSLPGALSETLLMSFDLEGIAVSNGSACSSGTVKSSYVLKAMNVPNETAAGSLRISTGWNTTEKDIDIFIDAFRKIYQRLKT